MTTGYVSVYVDGRVMLEHRYRLEVHLGRKLLTTEHVHHVNHDKKDNRIENLEIVTRKRHAVIHRESKLKYTDEFLLEKLCEIHSSTGFKPIINEFKERTGVIPEVVWKRFGTWNRAVNIALGTNYKKRGQIGIRPKISSAELLEDFSKVRQLLGKYPTVYEYYEFGKFHYMTLINRFKKWSIIKELGGS